MHLHVKLAEGYGKLKLPGDLDKSPCTCMLNYPEVREKSNYPVNGINLHALAC